MQEVERVPNINMEDIRRLMEIMQAAKTAKFYWASDYTTKSLYLGFRCIGLVYADYGDDMFKLPIRYVATINPTADKPREIKECASMDEGKQWLIDRVSEIIGAKIE